MSSIHCGSTSNGDLINKLLSTNFSSHFDDKIEQFGSLILSTILINNNPYQLGYGAKKAGSEPRKAGSEPTRSNKAGHRFRKPELNSGRLDLGSGRLDQGSKAREALRGHKRPQEAQEAQEVQEPQVGNLNQS